MLLPSIRTRKLVKLCEDCGYNHCLDTVRDASARAGVGPQKILLHRFESLATQDHRGHGAQVSTPLQLAISRPEHKGVKKDERVEYWKSPFLSMQVQLKL